MSKAGDYIRKNTKHFSNKWYDDLSQGYVPWLTPDQAREAAKIAREEIYEWLANHKDMSDYTWYDEIEHESGITDKCINDLKQAMKDE